MAAPGVTGGVFGVGVDADLMTVLVHTAVGDINHLIVCAGSDILRSSKNEAEAA